MTAFHKWDRYYYIRGFHAVFPQDQVNQFYPPCFHWSYASVRGTSWHCWNWVPYNAENDIHCRELVYHILQKTNLCFTGGPSPEADSHMFLSLRASLWNSMAKILLLTQYAEHKALPKLPPRLPCPHCQGEMSFLSLCSRVIVTLEHIHWISQQPEIWTLSLG